MMNKYTELSDDAVNAMVFISLYGEWSLKDKDMRRYFGRVDYCNNPSDAMPIIIETRIMLNPYCADDLWKCEVMVSKDDIFNIYAVCYNRNPLRAAMEVFLMMKDEESKND